MSLPEERPDRDPQVAPVARDPRDQIVLSDGTTVRAHERLTAADERRTIELREEVLVPRKLRGQAGEVVVRKTVEEVPGRLEVDAYAETVDVEHEPVGRAVAEKSAPWQDGEDWIIPVYEEQLVLVKRLVLKEQIRVRRTPTTEHRVFEDTLRRERLVVEDPNNTGRVRELYPTDQTTDSEPISEAPTEKHPPEGQPAEEESLLERVVHRALLG